MLDTQMSDTQKKSTSPKTKTRVVDTPEDLEVTALQEKLTQAELKYQRALADYQNLVRRTREDTARKAKLATKDFVISLITPLNHLSLAARQLDDAGLNMVIEQLWQTLNAEGLEKVKSMGKPFDAETMEVVEIENKGKKVTKVLTSCYKLNGEIIQFAKVVLD